MEGSSDQTTDASTASSFLTRLGDAELAELRRRLVRNTYRAGDVVFSQWEPGARLYIVESGSVRVTRESPGAVSVELAVLGPGAIFGELSIFTKQSRTATVTVLEDAILSSLSRADFQDLIEMHPGIALVCLQMLSDRLRDADQRIEDIAEWATNIETGRGAEAGNLQARRPLASGERLSRAELDYVLNPTQHAPHPLLEQSVSARPQAIRRQSRQMVDSLRDVGLLAEVGEVTSTVTTVAASLLLKRARRRSLFDCDVRDGAALLLLGIGWGLAAAARRYERRERDLSAGALPLSIHTRSPASDLIGVAAELLEEVETALQPAGARLWLRGASGGPYEGHVSE